MAEGLYRWEVRGKGGEVCGTVTQSHEHIDGEYENGESCKSEEMAKLQW